MRYHLYVIVATAPGYRWPVAAFLDRAAAVDVANDLGEAWEIEEVPLVTHDHCGCKRAAELLAYCTPCGAMYELAEYVSEDEDEDVTRTHPVCTLSP